jgi:hypothetical protein
MGALLQQGNLAVGAQGVGSCLEAAQKVVYPLVELPSLLEVAPGLEPHPQQQLEHRQVLHPLAAPRIAGVVKQAPDLLGPPQLVVLAAAAAAAAREEGVLTWSWALVSSPPPQEQQQGQQRALRRLLLPPRLLVVPGPGPGLPPGCL